MVVHFKHHCNTYGSLSAYCIALFIRLSGGEPILGLPALIHFPGYDEENNVQLFPFRTMAMLISLITLIGVSWGTKYGLIFGFQYEINKIRFFTDTFSRRANYHHNTITLGASLISQRMFTEWASLQKLVANR